MRIYEIERTPKYIQIYDWVHAMIQKTHFKVGDKIPTEPDLAQKFNSSRMTVRKAIDPLVLEGVLERRPGQGTFVVSTGIIKLTYDASKPIRFFHDMRKIGVSHSFEVVKKEVVNADDDIRRYLNLSGEQKVVCLTMIIYAAEKVALIERDYYPYNDFKEFMDMDISVPPMELLADRFNIQVKKVRQFISAVLAGEREMELFKVAYPFPCLYLEWVSCDNDGLPFSVSLCHYRSDIFKFKIPITELVSLDTV